MTGEKDKTVVNDEKITKERYLVLRFFCVVLELIGWLLIAGGVVWFMWSVVPNFPDMEKNLENFISIVSWYSFDFVFLGLMAMILAHLTRYIFDKGFHKSLLLRSGDKIFYLFSAFTILWAVFRLALYKNTVEDINWQTALVQSLLLPTVAKVLILVCLSQILKRILPVIEEYKSLV